MPNYVTVAVDELEVGQEVTAWWASLPSAGQGGKIVRIAETFLELRAGEHGEFQHTIAFDDVDHFTVERYLDADQCIEHHWGRCAGPVDYRHAPSGSTVIRCEFHNNKRWDEYEQDERSVARYANSDCAPDWLDESYAGERFKEDS